MLSDLASVNRERKEQLEKDKAGMGTGKSDLGL